MIAWLWLGCGAGPDPAAPPPAPAPCAPWDAWAPIGDGRIAHCDERRLHVGYPAASADTLAPAWRSAAEGAGWSQTLDTSAEGLVAVRYRHDETTLVLTLVDTPHATELAATVTTP